MKSKAIVLEKVEKVSVKELELPAMKADDLLVETQVSAVSVGTERWAYIGKRAEIGFPSVLGYMGIGKIVDMGPEAAAKGFKKGGLINFGKSRLPEGYDKTWMGTHLSHAVVNTAPFGKWDPEGGNFVSLQMVPEGVSPESVSLTQLCAVALRGIEMATVPMGVKVLVNGLGIIGQFAIQICKNKGALVAAADIDAKRLKLAGEYKADWIIDSGKEDVLARAAEITDGKGFDIIIDTASIPAVVNKIFPALKCFGKFIFQGWYPPPSSLDLNTFHGRLPTCYFPCGHTDRATSAAMRWVAEGHLDCTKMITHHVGVEDPDKIYRMITDNKEHFMGIIFDWRKK